MASSQDSKDDNAGVPRYEWEDGPVRYSADEKWGLERMEKGEWVEADDPAAITSACDQILLLAEERNALKVTLEESIEIEAEALAAIAVLCGDGTLKDCVDDCPGHLKPEALERFKESIDRWLAMQKENAKLTEGGQIMLKALRILTRLLWAAFKENDDLDTATIKEGLEDAGLIEMLADQTWSLTELGGRVCRRES